MFLFGLKIFVLQAKKEKNERIFLKGTFLGEKETKNSPFFGYRNTGVKVRIFLVKEGKIFLFLFHLNILVLKCSYTDPKNKEFVVPFSPNNIRTLTLMFLYPKGREFVVPFLPNNVPNSKMSLHFCSFFCLNISSQKRNKNSYLS